MIYSQIYQKIRGLILGGEWLEEDCLPSVRQLAKTYKLNHQTILRATQALVDEGILEKSQGRKYRIKTGAVKLLQRQEINQLKRDAKELCARAERLGLSRTEIVKIIRDNFKPTKGEQHAKTGKNTRRSEREDPSSADSPASAGERD